MKNLIVKSEKPNGESKWDRTYFFVARPSAPRIPLTAGVTDGQEVRQTDRRPLQLGGGLNHGAGIGARMSGLFLHREGSSVMSVDIENAFNSTRHRVIYDSLCLYYPSLLPFFRFKYEQSSPMRNNAGDIVAYTRTGVGQGDPWGSLFFELAIQIGRAHV